MQEHALTLKARSLMLRAAALDVELLETLGTIFKQKIYLEEGYQSIPDYCIRALGMSEDSAMRRRKAAELLGRYPSVLKPLLEQNKLHLTAIAMLHPIITDANAQRLLTEACGKRIYEIEMMIVREQPKPLVNPGAFSNFDQAGLPSLSPTASSQPSAKEDSASSFAETMEKPLPQAPRVKPLQVNAHHFQFIGDDATLELYNEVRDLEPGADANELFRRAMTVLRDELIRKKRSALKKTTAQDSAPQRKDFSKGEWVGSKRDKRYVNAPLRREVFARDHYCCQYTSKGRQCCSTRWLHLHHVIAWAKGGKTEASNLKVFCSAHNWYEGEREFGKRRGAATPPHNAGTTRGQSPAIADGQKLVAVDDVELDAAVHGAGLGRGGHHDRAGFAVAG